MAEYDRVFFTCNARWALSTARCLVPLVGNWVRPRSIVDFGCGPGVWLAAWQEWGVAATVGVDQSRPDDGGSWLTGCRFVEADLCHPVRLGRTFDLVQCLEVGEHLPPTAAETLVHTLTAHAPVVLFSAALPGQGGFQHVNEQRPEYWRDLFARRGFGATDCVRPHLIRQPGVRLCSRYNTFLYVHESQWPRLPQEVQRARLPDHQPIPDPSPRLLRIGRAVVRRLPVSLVSLVDRLLRVAQRPGRAPPAHELPESISAAPANSTRPATCVHTAGLRFGGGRPARASK